MPMEYQFNAETPYADVTFLVGEELVPIRAHRIILDPQSRMLARLFRQHPQEATFRFPEIPVAHFRYFLQSIYAKEFSLDRLQASVFGVRQLDALFCAVMELADRFDLTVELRKSAFHLLQTHLLQQPTAIWKVFRNVSARMLKQEVAVWSEDIYSRTREILDAPGLERLQPETLVGIHRTLFADNPYARLLTSFLWIRGQQRGENGQERAQAERDAERALWEQLVPPLDLESMDLLRLLEGSMHLPVDPARAVTEALLRKEAFRWYEDRSSWFDRPEPKQVQQAMEEPAPTALDQLLQMPTPPRSDRTIPPARPSSPLGLTEPLQPPVQAESLPHELPFIVTRRFVIVPAYSQFYQNVRTRLPFYPHSGCFLAKLRVVDPAYMRVGFLPKSSDSVFGASRMARPHVRPLLGSQRCGWGFTGHAIWVNNVRAEFVHGREFQRDDTVQLYVDTFEGSIWAKVGIGMDHFHCLTTESPVREPVYIAATMQAKAALELQNVQRVNPRNMA